MCNQFVDKVSILINKLSLEQKERERWESLVLSLNLFTAELTLSKLRVMCLLSPPSSILVLLSLIDSRMANIKMKSSLSYPHSTRIIIICTIYFSVYLFSNLTNVQGFDPLLQLPKYRNSINTITSKRFLSVNDYGAKGDGLTDDTKVPTTINHILYL